MGKAPSRFHLTAWTLVHMGKWMDWKDYLTTGERKVIQAMDARHAADAVIRRRIYERCWKRLARERKRKERENEQG